jgi:hypothetical protein
MHLIADSQVMVSAITQYLISVKPSTGAISKDEVPFLREMFKLIVSEGREVSEVEKDRLANSYTVMKLSEGILKEWHKDYQNIMSQLDELISPSAIQDFIEIGEVISLDINCPVCGGHAVYSISLGDRKGKSEKGYCKENSCFILS